MGPAGVAINDRSHRGIDTCLSLQATPTPLDRLLHGGSPQHYHSAFRCENYRRRYQIGRESKPNSALLSSEVFEIALRSIHLAFDWLSHLPDYHWICQLANHVIPKGRLRI